MTRRFKVKYIFFFLLFFFIPYLEGVDLGGMFSFAQLWKIPVLAFLLFYLIKKQIRQASFSKLTYWFSGVTFLNRDIFISPLGAFLFASKLLPFPLFFEYFNSLTKKYGQRLETILYSLAQFVALSSLLTLTGLVVPLSNWQIAEGFGEDLFYYSSVFGNAHPASSYFCVAMFVLLNGFKVHRFRTKSARFFNMGLIAICFISILKAYVRTGWLMLIVGIICLFKPNKISKKALKRFTMAVIVILFGLLYLLQTNEEFRNRLAGQQIENTESFTVETTGSGRMDFWKNGLELWADGEWYEILLGNGTVKVRENNMAKIGLPIGSHNLFIDVLVEFGIIGFILLMSYYYRLYLYINAPIRRNSSYRPLVNATFYASIVFAFFQSVIYFIYAVFFALILALHNYEGKQLTLKRNETTNS